MFTQQQKEIRIEYYNRQAKYGIRADTGECAATMRERGLEALKDSQIKSWEFLSPKMQKRNGKDGSTFTDRM